MPAHGTLSETYCSSWCGALFQSRFLLCRTTLSFLFVDQVAVFLNYLRPYWIQRLLESLSAAAASSSEPPSWSPRDQAYVYALLAVFSMVLRSLTELQHYHLARRIGMRLRSELTVAIFEKALRRRDMKGRTEGNKKEEAKEKGRENASVGRVVSLISEDTNRVLRMVRVYVQFALRDTDAIFDRVVMRI